MIYNFLCAAILLEKGYISCLVELLTKIPVDESKETVLSAMLTFVEGFYDAIEECKKEEHNLKPTLDYLIAHYKDDVAVNILKIKLQFAPSRFGSILIISIFIGGEKQSNEAERRIGSIFKIDGMSHS